MWLLVFGRFFARIEQDIVFEICHLRGTSLHCDIPFWTAQAILEYAGKTEEVVDEYSIDCSYSILSL